MNSERIIRIMAGSFILLSLLLGAPASPLYHSGYWLWFTAFVGFNLFQRWLHPLLSGGDDVVEAGRQKGQPPRRRLDLRLFQRNADE